MSSHESWQRETAQEQSSQEATVSVPPIRRLIIRGPPRLPSIKTLQSESQTSLGLSDSPRLHQKVSLTIRKTVTELERLLNEAIVDSARRNENKSSGTRKKPEHATKQHTTPIKETHHLPQSPCPEVAKHQPSALPESTNNHRATARTQSSQRTFQTCATLHGKNTTNKSALAPATISKSSLLELHELDKPETIVEARIPSNTCQDIRTNVDTETKGAGDRQHQQEHNVRQPRINVRSSSIRHKPLLDPRKTQYMPSIPRLQLNGQDLVENKDNPKLEPESTLRSFNNTRHFTEMFEGPSRNTAIMWEPTMNSSSSHKISLKRKGHVDLYNCPERFNIHETSGHASVARHWPLSRKRFAACLACMNTSCTGILLGIYAGEVPAIQYVIADTHHYAILGNVLLYIGLAWSTFVFWPLPLLHGRKPYIVTPLLIALATQVPQGLAVSGFRDPNVVTYRGLLLVSRSVSGLALGLSDMNLIATLLDLYGASLQSSNPSQENLDPYDVRRHGGGMGIWLGIWSWCSIGSISIGFMTGASIINNGASVTWGFWTGLLMLIFVLFLNTVGPEVRRSAFRRTISEITGKEGSFNRWGEEVLSGFQLCWRMVKQPGFLVLSIYAAWTYAQYNLILMLLGALTSRIYRFRPVFVGLCTLSLAVGAATAVPFQRASWFSRSRTHPPRTDSSTIKEKIRLNSHVIRRGLFTLLLPIAATAYTVSSVGPHIPIAVPCIIAALIGFLSNLAVAECYGLIMENFDTSDLQPGMTGHPNRRSVADDFAGQRTNFSCYPRVSAGIIVTQTLKYLLAAVATSIGGRVQQHIGTVFATAVVAGILFVLTILLTVVLIRWKTVQMIPDKSNHRPESSITSDKWEPVILGNPSGTTRKLSILQLGSQTRWSEIRRKNRLEDNVTSGQKCR